MYWELQLLSSVWLFATLFARGQVVETNSQKMNGWWPGEGWEEGIVREVGVDMCTCSVQFSCSVVSDSLQPHGLQHTSLPCPSPNPGAFLDSCSSSWWCHPTISSSVVPFSSCLQFFAASGSFPMSQLFTPGGQSTGVSASASVLPMNIQDWFLLGWTGWISLQSKGLSRIFSSTKFWKHPFFGAQLS